MRVILALCLILGTCSCENSSIGATGQGAIGGGALGAGLGAIIGHATGHTGAGIAIGSAAGVLAGGAYGSQVDKQREQTSKRDQRINDQQAQIQENQRIIEELRRRGADARSTERGVVVNLPDVLFEFNKARLTTDALRTTKEIAGVIREVDNRTIAVEGHTDSVGTIVYNQKLSEDRAGSVANELVANGISRRRISTHGYGETDPIASNNADSGRARNRRVEVIIENR